MRVVVSEKLRQKAKMCVELVNFVCMVVGLSDKC